MSEKIERPISDEEWKALLDPAQVLMARRAGEKEYADHSTDTIKYFRRRAKFDLFFLGQLLGYNKGTARFHGHLCGWLTSMMWEHYRLILMARGHYKTSYVTKVDSIRLILPDDDGFYPEPYNLGPECRILLAHETHDGASRFLYGITHHLTRNPQLVGLFPEIVPNLRKTRANKYELELPRQGAYDEPTFDTLGVGGKSQGRHYNFIKLDDIFGDKARDSKTERETTIQWFDNIQSFSVDLSTFHLDLVGTRYSLDDVYSHAMEVYEDQMKRYIRMVEEPNEEGQIVPVFPEGGFTPERLKILRKNPKVWAAQYCNNPQEGLAEFDQGWKRFYYYASPTRIAFFAGQASTSYHVRNDLDISILCDPSVSKLPGIIVTGVSPKLQVFVLETIKENMKPPQFVEIVFRLVQKYWPRVVSIESVVFSKVYADWMRREQVIRGVRFNIHEWVPPNRQRKDERIATRLSNYFAAGQIFFSEQQTDLIWEFDNFGATDNTHLLDALAQGPDVWRPGLDAKTWAQYREAEQQLLNDRDVATGYSKL